MPPLAPDEPADRIHSSQLTFAGITTATLWGGSASAIALAVRALRVIVVAPFVSAHDFGLLAVTHAMLEGVNAFSDLGTQASIVRHPGRVSHVLDTAFTLQAIRGFTLAALLFAAAPLAGAWLRDDALVPVARAMALVPLVAGFGNPAMVLLTRRLEFRRLFAWGLVEPAVTLTIAIWLAVTLRSVWALVLAALCGEVVRVGVSYIAARPWPRFSLQRQQVAELIQFGRWVAGSRILMFLSVRGDDLFVATVLGTTVVGVYSVAFRIAELPVLLVSHVIVGVALPVWSSLADEPDRLRVWFVRTCLWAGMASSAVAIAAVAIAPQLVPLPAGMTWATARPLFLVLVLASLGRSLIILAEPYFYSIGKPGVWFRMNVWRVGTTAILIVPLTRMYGIVGVALAVTAGVFSTIPIVIHEMINPKPPRE